MQTFFKNGLALTALSLSLAGHAYEYGLECREDIMACGIALTTAATPNPLAVDPIAPTITGPYTVTNVQTTGDITLTSVAVSAKSDNLAGASAVTLDGTTTCTASLVLAPSDTCDIYLSYDPTNAGLLDFNLVITPATTQRPVTWNLVSTVQGYSIAGGTYFSTYNYPMIAVSTDEGSTWAYELDNADSMPTNFTQNGTPGQENALVRKTECVGSLCLTAGRYTDNVGPTIWPLIATNSAAGSTWTYPVDSSFTFPVGTQTGELYSVSCAEDRSVCVAVGNYTDGSGTHPLLMKSTDAAGGSWTVVDFSSEASQLYSVDCNNTLCVAVGVAGSGAPVVKLGTSAGSSWVDATTITTPGDYVSMNDLGSVSCSSSNSVCIAFGSYNNGAPNKPLLLLSTDSGVTWSPQINASYDTNIARIIKLFGTGYSTSCTESLCAIGAAYEAVSNGNKYPLFVVSEAPFTTWTEKISDSTSTPNGFVGAVPTNNYTAVNGVSCFDFATTSKCLAGGAYLTSAQFSFMGAMYDLTANTLTYTLDNTSTQPSGSVTGLKAMVGASCRVMTTSSALCVMGGGYSTATATSVPVEAVSTDSGATWTYGLDNASSAQPTGGTTFGVFYATNAGE